MAKPVPIQIDHNGKTYKGTYTIDAANNMITVTYEYNGKSKFTQLGGSARIPEPLAKIILRELVIEALTQP